MPDKLCFFSGSADAKVGHGVGESVASTLPYMSLGGYEHWRRYLSNFHAAPFTMKFGERQLTFVTIEHAFQAAKFFVTGHGYDEFVGGDGRTAPVPAIGGTGLDARRMRKKVVLGATALARWDAVKDEFMLRARLAKYRQCEFAATILEGTGAAELWHVIPRQGIVRDTILEEVRRQLRMERVR